MTQLYSDRSLENAPRGKSLVAFVGVINVALICLAGWFAYQSLWLKWYGTKTEAVVVKGQTDYEGSQQSIFEFEDTTGKKHYILSSLSDNDELPYPIGSRYIVYFDPKNPEDVKIDAFAEMWIEILLVGFGAFLFFVFFLVMRAFKLNMKKRYAELQEKGIWIETNFDKVTEREDEGEIQYRIVTLWRNPKDQHLLQFESEYFSTDPRPKLIGVSFIKVFVNPERFSDFYMEIPFKIPS